VRNVNRLTYIFNLTTLRFLNIYDIGYVGGKDDNSDNPAVAVGICTKID
jgi:hypothetical protein